MPHIYPFSAAKDSFQIKMLAPVLNDSIFAGFDDRGDHRFGRPHTHPPRPGGADFDDRGDTAGGLRTRATPQNKQLSSRAFGLGMSNDGSRRVPNPAARSWSPRRLSRAGAFGPAGALGAAVGKDLDQTSPPSTRTSAVARIAKDFRNWFRVEASGSIGPMCFLSGAGRPAPAHRPR